MSKTWLYIHGNTPSNFAVRTVAAALQDKTSIERVVFCCFGAPSLEHHQAALAASRGD